MVEGMDGKVQEAEDRIHMKNGLSSWDVQLVGALLTRGRSRACSFVKHEGRSRNSSRSV